MRLYLLFTLAAIVAQASAVSKSTVNTRLNGWYKCPDYTFSDEGSSTGHYSECATFNVPLCYPGICKTPQFADPTIDVFVKRMPATTGDVKTATNVWLLEGDPGYSSTACKCFLRSPHGQYYPVCHVLTWCLAAISQWNLRCLICSCN
ncbi:hypothetical protein PF010_g28454 [Phytophthora fragariae]|uniref:CBM1 domain-containing protein n=1 Tax=Phytophthora fragariae TaxID=53985 RepID=A0A6A3QH68_9STRA|nr:hypothetical protein PF011_g27875 [Phytophthora fragariae]KAE9064845.1 hypothetical protein PF010_g28454 [Phytophthora fragariae]KAE9076464.1 hypothetical protein PF006_g28124 [Phytophthora fragariae]KAE9173109.1 hypothetical protein PF002_g29391 [Phytophthora fragariae]